VTAVSPVFVVFAALGLGTVWLLHLFEPTLRFTWSFAGLGRNPVLPWVAMLLVLVLPPLTALAWRSEMARRPTAPFGVRAVLVWVSLLWVLLFALGSMFSAPDVCPDVLYLKSALRTTVPGNPRWLLTVPLFRALRAPLASLLDPAAFLKLLNALLTAGTIVCTAAIARRLGETVRAAAAVFLLVWTAFGTVQLALGYVDVYPLVQLLVALYVWTALRFLQDNGSLAWPVASACVAPFFYVVLIVLSPSLLLLAALAWRSPGGLRRIALASAGGAALASIATVPRFGRPAAFATFATVLDEAGRKLPGLDPDTLLLPLSYMLTFHHVLEFLHALLLLDPTGLVISSTLVPLALARPTPVALFLAAIVAPGLYFMFTIDPLWGAYADWDLFSYLALPITLLSAAGFLAFARVHEGLAPWLLGLALAASGTHLAARLNSLDVHFDRHLAESPYHIEGLPPGVFRSR
jgi:hypothetical protein